MQLTGLEKIFVIKITNDYWSNYVRIYYKSFRRRLIPPPPKNKAGKDYEEEIYRSHIQRNAHQWTLMNAHPSFYRRGNQTQKGGSPGFWVIVASPHDIPISSRQWPSLPLLNWGLNHTTSHLTIYCILFSFFFLFMTLDYSPSWSVPWHFWRCISLIGI